MKILHVTPHLGGGVGKAHAALSAVLPKNAVEQTFLLLEQPRDPRYANLIAENGAAVVVAGDLDHIARLASAADIVQFEFWNHPRLFECLARCEFPAMRSVFWSHISGLAPPIIQPGLMQEGARFVFTTEASLSMSALKAVSEPGNIRVINSGFGFAGAPKHTPRHNGKLTIAYLGTVDFVKMHPVFFDTVDRLDADNVLISVWGNVDLSGDVARYARAMRHPERIAFRGETAAPAVALSQADIFFYPLQSDHYGTAENVLIEAMSLGLVPVVMNNPAEMAIVRDGENGFVAHSTEQCISLLQMLLSSPEQRSRISQNAVRYVTENRMPLQAAQEFMILWLGLLGEPARHCDFRRVIGESPADWFLATQHLSGAGRESAGRHVAGKPAKGSLAHFESIFAGDTSLTRLRG